MKLQSIENIQFCEDLPFIDGDDLSDIEPEHFDNRTLDIFECAAEYNQQIINEMFGGLI